MRAWINSLRLSVCALASLLAIAGFKVAGTEIQWVAIVAVFFIATASMIQNDWRDRFHDVRKGKTLALRHPRAFLAWVLSFWALSGITIATASILEPRTGTILAAMALAGGVYSETRKVPLVPILLVSLVSASPALLPLGIDAGSQNLWLLFIVAALVIFAREITKDLDDSGIDGGYKWTLPSVLGDKLSRTLAAVTILVGSITLLHVSLTTLPAASLAVIGAALLVQRSNPHASRKWLDAGIALAILTLIVFE